jgi:hypothetical protein
MTRIQSGHFIQITPIIGLFQSNIYSIGSILTQPSLIIITLQNTQNESDVKTLLINSVGYIIQGETQQYQLTFGAGLSELQGKRPSTYIGTGQQQFAMTGVEPIDINILLQMDDQTLTSACQTDRYISGLCRSEELWRLKIEKDYYGAGEYKNKDRTWREYYKILHQSGRDEDGANDAADSGHLDVLKWLASLQPPIPIGVATANYAAENGHLDVLEWMESLTPKILPTASGANYAAESGHLDVLKWMESLTPKILPTAGGANEAAGNGHLDVLIWMASLTPKILPGVNGAEEAEVNEHLDVLEWMASLQQPILRN